MCWVEVETVGSTEAARTLDKRETAQNRRIGMQPDRQHYSRHERQQGRADRSSKALQVLRRQAARLRCTLVMAHQLAAMSQEVANEREVAMERQAVAMFVATDATVAGVAGSRCGT